MKSTVNILDKLSIPAQAYSKNNYVRIFFIDLFMGDNYCHKKYLEEVFHEPATKPRGRHKKFSSIGNDLTKQVFKGKTYKTNRKINNIAVHCTATPIGRDIDAHDIDNMHINRWGVNSGCGYHYIIKLDGTIEKGRWVDYGGAHVRGRNSDTIAVSYVGGVDKNLNAVEDAATDAQVKSLEELLSLLVDLYNLDPKDVLGHREFPKVYKACPCLTMDDIRKNI